jgi:A/G-specific adenine glycosylase
MECEISRSGKEQPSRLCGDQKEGAAARLLAWYGRHRRNLPWRAAPGERAEPYKVWLSEIMLQQTTAAAVKPYFTAFVSRWPDVGSLARAGSEEILRAWAGLGYYARARNLHACARIVANELGGEFPSTEAELQRLPGVGPYTAAAIAAIAFGRQALAIDGNVERVLARLLAIEAPRPRLTREIKARAADLVPEERPGDFNQALMDLGASLCAPKAPACKLCPLRESCLGFVSGAPESLPQKLPRPEKPVRYGAVFFVRRKDGALLVRTRPPKGLLGGMVELPGTDWKENFGAAEALSEAPVATSYRKLSRQVTHTFTHFRLRLDVYVAEDPQSLQAPEGGRFLPEDELEKEAFSSVMRKVIAAARRPWQMNSQSGFPDRTLGLRADQLRRSGG